MTTRRRLAWLAPLALLLLAVTATLLALPRFVASNAHRATIEALASSLTGRQVRIGGPLSLALLPAPRLIAADVRIGGPAGESITARSLTMDIALPALLRGRLAASNLTLGDPTITLPWPLPGGAAGILPPPLLARLHGQIGNGAVRIGALRLDHVDADLFTAGDGALSISGVGDWNGMALSLSLGLAAPDADGKAALAADCRTPDGRLGGHFSGMLEGDSAVTGGVTATFLLPGEATPVSGAATLTADAAQLRLSDLHLAEGSAKLSGAGTFDLAHPSFALDLLGSDLDATTLVKLLAPGSGLPSLGPPGTLKLSAIGLRLPFGTLPRLDAEMAFDGAGVTLRRLTASLPGDASLDLTGRIDDAGTLTATANLAATDIAGLLAGFGVHFPPAGWRQATLRTELVGDRSHLALTGLDGRIGDGRLSGDLVARWPGGQPAADGALHFDQLDLEPVIDLLRGGHLGGGVSLSGEVTADRAHYGRLVLDHLLLDGELHGQLVVRRLSAALYGGVFVSSFTATPQGELTTARALLALPSATPLLDLLPTPLPLPAVLADAPLSLSVAAAGTPDRLATSAVASLGDVAVTASPVLDLTRLTAAGPLTLRHPDAIAALLPFGLNAGLAWPGAGSISLRADFKASPGQFSLPDFDLSFGDLTANGSLTIAAGPNITARIDAGTLALPPLPAKVSIPWARLTAVRGDVAISADHVWLGGQPLLDGGAATLTLAPHRLSFDLTHAAIGAGTLSGALSADTSATIPALGLKLDFNGIDGSVLAPGSAFLYAPVGGTLAGRAVLTAAGYGSAAWLATLAGDVSLDGTNGQFAGFDLAGLGTALKTAGQAGWRPQAVTGASNFASLDLSGSLAGGVLSLRGANLQGPDGSAAATGDIDIPDRALNLRLTLSPGAIAPAAIPVTVLGPWAAPRQILPPKP